MSVDIYYMETKCLQFKMIVYKTRINEAFLIFRTEASQRFTVHPPCPRPVKALHREDGVAILRRYPASAAAADLATLVLIVLDKKESSYYNQAVETPTQQIADIKVFR